MTQAKGRRIGIVGAGQGGVFAALALLAQGYDVRLFERQSEPKALGGAVLLSVPVLAILRHYGIGLDNFGSKTQVEFRNNRGQLRARLPWQDEIARKLGNIFHPLPASMAALRDFIYDNTGFLGKQITKDDLGEQEAMCMSLTETPVMGVTGKIGMSQ